MVSQNGYSHSRRIQMQKDGYRILDTVSETSNSSCVISFHTPCKAEQFENEIRLYDGGKCICTLKSNLTAEIRKSVRSLYYLRKEEITEINFQLRTNEKKAIAETKIMIGENKHD
jgi:hypothetical protein